MVKILRPNNGDTNKKKKNKTKINPNAVAMKVKAPVAKPNPFETVWSRRKFDILGKKRKGEERRIGLARSLAIEKVIIVFLLINDSVYLTLVRSYDLEIVHTELNIWTKLGLLPLKIELGLLEMISPNFVFEFFFYHRPLLSSSRAKRWLV